MFYLNRINLQVLWLPMLLAVLCGVNKVVCEIEHNTINDDGSFSFRHSNDDIGGYYHSAAGNPDIIVRGRYGSRSPASGQVEEVVYTAGPRGFRANGPRIHRKMDLSQYPPRPIGTPDDPLADPFDDPSYSFSYRAAEHSRSEENDANGRVRGLYSYIDDVGERHSVRYAAGAGTGFEVLNSVPDNPAIVGYTAPLYKAHPKTRGKMTTQRGPNGSYKVIASGPDHRRAETRDPDGLVRGTYSYLDDQGVQRTVEYIAGAGIGYRIVKNRMGPGTHINPSLAGFRLSDTDFRLASEYGRGAGGGLGRGGSGSGGTGAGRGGTGSGGAGLNRGGTGSGSTALSRGGTGSGSSSNSGNVVGGAGGGEYLKAGNSGRIRPNKDGGDRPNNADNFEDKDDTAGIEGGDGSGSADRTGNAGNRSKTNRIGGAAVGIRGGTRYRGGSGSGGGAGGNDGGYGNNGGYGNEGSDDDTAFSRGGNGSGGNRGSGGFGGAGGAGKLGGRGGNRPPSNRNTLNSEERSRNRNRITGGGGGGSAGSASASKGGSATDDGYSYDAPSSNNYDLNDDDVGGSLPPLITANRKILEVDRERDWVQRHHDSTVIKNVGNWYIGLPPGQSVRAHVQNIDLLPLGGRRIPSPSEALRQDEIADMKASLESQAPYSS